MRIAIVTDAWTPQVNGVVRTLTAVRRVLEAQGDHVTVIGPDRFASLPCPTYPEIRLAVTTSRRVGALLEQAAPDAIHLSTEGPLCLAARRWCVRRNLSFTTAYHTQFPHYVAQRSGLPAAWMWRYIRWFHRPSRAVLVSTPSIRRELTVHGIRHLRAWGRGVDLTTFRPNLPLPDAFVGLLRPIQLYVGRVAVEKNVDAFLTTRHPGSRIVVGDGPARDGLARRHGDAVFLGALFGDALARAYANADVLVFPSRTDTFGLVIAEALACGTPVAAYPAPGPIDVLTPEVGCVAGDLGTAIAGALTCDRVLCAMAGAEFSWARSAAQFRDALVPLCNGRRAPAARPISRRAVPD